MKRLLPVLLGAFAGAIELPVLMLFVSNVAALLPALGRIGTLPHLSLFLTSVDGRVHVAVGALLGVWSVVLWQNQPLLWPRLGSIACSACVVAYYVWFFTDQLRTYGAASFHNYILPMIVFQSPLLLWSLALLFFAILARRRTVLR